MTNPKHFCALALLGGSLITAPAIAAEPDYQSRTTESGHTVERVTRSGTTEAGTDWGRSAYRVSDADGNVVARGGARGARTADGDFVAQRRGARTTADGDTLSRRSRAAGNVNGAAAGRRVMTRRDAGGEVTGRRVTRSRRR